MKNYMKTIFLAFLASAILFNGCQPSASPDSIPEDTAGRRALLEQKLKERLALDDEIKTLEQLLGKENLPALDEKPKQVTTQVISKSTFRRFTEIQGNVEPAKINQISSETGGRIVRLYVQEGDQVKAGQVLAALDMEPVQKQLEEIESAYALAQDVYNRQQRLWDQQIGSEIQYLQAKNNKERLEKSMATLKAQLKKSQLYAPIGGVIEMINIKQGDVAPPSAPIMTLINTSELKIVADVPERFVNTVKPGDKVQVAIPAVNETQESRVSVVGKMIHPSNRTFRVESTLKNGKNPLKPNLLAIMEIEDYRELDAIVVSVDLVQQEIGGNFFVFVKKEVDGVNRAEKKYITTGESYNNMIVVKSGLTEGDEIVVSGARGLAENDILEIQK